MAKKKKKQKDVDPADEVRWTTNQLRDMGEAAFHVGMKVIQAMATSGDAVFVTKEQDPVTRMVVYHFEPYNRYRLVKDES